ncbi:MAG TPA: MBL fold metallo-hydrolase [Chitinophagaceae bacterium]|nr:MBL fold metallo-hydrolase [Chitinophagaceae bacterium]
MQRRHFITTALAGTGGLLLAQQQLLAALLQQPAYKITMLGKDAGIFTEKGGTILFVMGKEGIITVDAQFPEQSQHLIDELKKRSGQPFRLLINTHHHYDHTAGNISFKGVAEHVLAHENSLKNQQNVAIAQKTEDKQLYPDQTYGSVWNEKAAGFSYALHYFGAGHTNGDSLVYFKKQGIVHMGDLVFNRRHPFVDRSAGANINSWISVLDKAMQQFPDKTVFVFGHAAEGYQVTGSKTDLKAFQTYLKNLLSFTAAHIAAGKSKEELLKATEIPGSPEWKGDGIERPLTAAYEELTATTK